MSNVKSKSFYEENLSKVNAERSQHGFKPLTLEEYIKLNTHFEIDKNDPNVAYNF